MDFIPYVVIHSVFYQLKKELCSENVLELSYKIVTGFKQHLNEITETVVCLISQLGTISFKSLEIEKRSNRHWIFIALSLHVDSCAEGCFTRQISGRLYKILSFGFHLRLANVQTLVYRLSCMSSGDNGQLKSAAIIIF